MEQTNTMLSKARLINWHACSASGIINLSGDSMIAGATGAGKSTLVDAIFSTIFVDCNYFNKAADSKSTRDLRSYHRYRTNEIVAGEKVRYKRKGRVITYVLVEITKYNKQKMILGVCYTSKDETSDIEKDYFAISDVNIEDVRLLDANNCPLTFDAFKQQFDANHSCLTHCRKKDDAIRLFAATVIGTKDRDNKEKFMNIRRRVADAIAFSPSAASNIDAFFRQKIWEEDNIDMDEIRAKSATYEDLQSRFTTLQTRSEEIKQIHDVAREVVEIDKKRHIAEIIDAIASYEDKKARLNRATQQRDAHEARLVALDAELEDLNATLDAFKQQKVLLENGTDIERELKTMRDTLNRCQIELRSSTADYNQFTERMSQVKEIMQKILHIYPEIAREMPDDIDLSNPYEAEQNLEDFCSRINAIHNALAQKNGVLNAGLNRAKADIKSKTTDIYTLMAGKPILDEPTTRVLKAVNQVLSELGSKTSAIMLYECLDIKPEYAEWKDAIEAYLGKSRFNIIVPPEFYAEATKVLKSMSVSGVSIIDTTATKAESTRDDSICNLLIFSNPHAESYIKYRYGNVIAIESCVKSVPNTKCSYLGKDRSLYTSRCFSMLKAPHQSCIGSAGREDNIKALQQEIADIEQEANSANAQITIIDEALRASERLIAAAHNINATMLKNIKELPIEIQRLQSQIATIEEDDESSSLANMLADIAEQISQKTARMTKIDADKRRSIERLGALKQEIVAHESQIDTLRDACALFERTSESIYKDAREEYDAIIAEDPDSISIVADKYRKEKQKQDSAFNVRNTRLLGYQEAYARQYNPNLSFEGLPSQSLYEDEYTLIFSDTLPKLQVELEQSQSQQMSVIYDDVIKKLQANIEKTFRARHLINKALRGVRYGNRVYEIAPIAPADDKAEAFSIIQSYDGIAYSALTSEEEKQRAKENCEFIYRTICENERNLDYRNYMKFDVIVTTYEGETPIKKQFLSESYGDFSGGEKQMPFYILCAIGLLNIYSGDTSKEMLKLNILDEAFDKMDSHTIESMIQYFKMLGFQTIISAPDSKNEIIMPFVDNMISVINNQIGRTFININKERAYISFAKQDAERSA